MRCLIAFIFLFQQSVFSQSASIKAIKLRVSKEIFNTPDTTIFFPIVIVKNKLASSRINNAIRKGIIEEYDNNKSLLKNLRFFIEELRVHHLSYDITLNHKILSINIFKEGCGAYCSSNRTYFNFDMATGKQLSIKNIVPEKKLDSFTQIIKADKIKFLEGYKKEQNEQFKDVADPSTHNWIIEQVNGCMASINLNQFSLTKDSIEIIDACDFPHAIRGQQPFYELKYPYKQISRFLKPGIKLH